MTDARTLLSVRDIDNLTEAARAMSMQLAESNRLFQLWLDLGRRQLEVQRDIRDSVDALREVIVRAGTNGHAQDAHAESEP